MNFPTQMAIAQRTKEVPKEVAAVLKVAEAGERRD